MSPAKSAAASATTAKRLSIQYKGLSISDLLNSTVADALPVLGSIPQVHRKLQTLVDVGLGYIGLGQPATTLSGGEAQRIKLAKELSKRATGKTFTSSTNPRPACISTTCKKLLDVLNRLTDLGNTVIIIEHHLDVIKTADWVIDLGPDGGVQGGRVMAAGTPEQVARVRKIVYRTGAGTGLMKDSKAAHRALRCGEPARQIRVLSEQCDADRGDGRKDGAGVARRPKDSAFWKWRQRGGCATYCSGIRRPLRSGPDAAPGISRLRPTLPP